MTYPTEGHNCRTDVWKSAHDHHYAATDFPQPERSLEIHPIPERLRDAAARTAAGDRQTANLMLDAAARIDALELLIIILRGKSCGIQAHETN
jgi:hypothetical protein